MNKTVNINLSGIVFHIEEDAYQKLHQYLNTIRGYFSESEGRDEIMADIENRIAEMLSEKITDRKQVILMADVDTVISAMGKPEDFAGDKSEGSPSSGPAPAATEMPHRRRRLFRDPDNKILGGVCSGIGAYFNIDPVWLRLILAVAFFAFGTGFLLYIVLWVIMPEAKSSSEKLEMRGEAVNFSNIGKKVEEEMSGFGKRMEGWGNEVKESVNSRNVNNGVQNVLDFMGSLFTGFFRVFAKILGVFLAIIGLLLLVGIFSSMFGGTGLIHIDNESFSIREGLGLFFESQQQEVMAGFAIFLFAGIPLIMMVYGGIKLLLGIKTKNKYVGIGAGVLWLVGLLLMIILGNQVAGGFAAEETSKRVFPLQPISCDTLFLRAEENNTDRFERKRWSKHLRMRVKNHDIISADSNYIHFGFPQLNIVRSESDSFEVVVYATARGKDRKEALHLARAIEYDIHQADSVIEFASNFSVPRDEKWRAQEVHIEVRVPKGKMVYLSKSMNDIIYDISNETDTWDGDMLGRRWIMGSEELRCVDCDGLNLDYKERRKNREKEERIEVKIPEAPALPAEPAKPAEPTRTVKAEKPAKKQASPTTDTLK